MTQKLFVTYLLSFQVLSTSPLDNDKPKTEYVSFYFNSNCVADVMVLTW